MLPGGGLTVASARLTCLPEVLGVSGGADDAATTFRRLEASGSRFCLNSSVSRRVDGAARGRAPTAATPVLDTSVRRKLRREVARQRCNIGGAIVLQL